MKNIHLIYAETHHNKETFIRLCTNIKEIYSFRKHGQANKEHLYGECAQSKGDHIHILARVKYSMRDMRDWRVDGQMLKSKGIDPLWKELWSNDLEWITIKHIKSDKHFDNTYKYIEQYAAPAIKDWYELKDKLLRQVNKYSQSIQQDEEWLFFAQQPNLKPDKQEELLLQKFRQKYPRRCDWQRYCAMNHLNAAKIQRFNEYEQKCHRYERTRSPTRELSKTEERFKNDAIMYLNMLDKKQKENGIGAGLIFGGASGTGKSTMCRLIAELREPFSKWTGRQFIEKDPLKWDDAVKKQIRTLIVEEMEWTVPLKKIDLTQTLDLIKQVLVENLEMRVAKNVKVQKFTSLTLDTLLFSYNPNKFCPEDLLAGTIQNDPAMSRRLIYVSFPDIFETTKQEFGLPERERIDELEILRHINKTKRVGITRTEYLQRKEQLFNYKRPDIEEQFNALLELAGDNAQDETYETFLEEYTSFRTGQYIDIKKAMEDIEDFEILDE